ncbi:MAG: sigma-70 family RNA polymerase sigma factor [Armatimonadetes bacterium]|nr:sigma-70 family RNA polymerase sigma factor [Armatimonadota bacterium]
MTDMDASFVRMSTLDQELVRRWRNGDAGAFAELVHLYRETVYRLAYAVVRAWRAGARCDPDYGFGGWIRRITVNCATARLRRRREPEPEPPEPLEPRRGPHQQAEAAELQARVRGAIRGLPLQQRLAVTLFHLDGLDLAATAQALGCSVGAAKSHLHRAREKLATALADQLEED